MVIATCVLLLLLVSLVVCLQLNLIDDRTSDRYKLKNTQKINITLVVIVLCHVCLVCYRLSFVRTQLYRRFE